jgi:FKBP-type peptidyl-prolyl cis-trans isomerase
MRHSWLLLLLALACQKSEPKHDAGKKPGQVVPPYDLKTPPPDAVKTATGLVYKKEVTNDAGPVPHKNDTVIINYTGWQPTTGDTFFSTKTRGQPMPLNLATSPPGFTEAMQLLHKGEKAMLWVPPQIGYKGQPQGTPETLVYEVEVMDILPAPPIPSDVAAPPDNAQATKSGIKLEVVRAGTGKDKPRPYDIVTFNYTGWDAEGRMFDTTEMKKHPAKVAPFRQSPPFEEILTSMVAGERVRFWIDAAKLQEGKPVPGMPTGRLCYEVDLMQIEKGADPPPVPPDVAKPPPDAKKTPRGVYYKVLKSGKGGPKPTPRDTVRVNYTGWTTDGKMFDSSVIRNEPAEFSLQGGMLGWTEGITQMSVGDKYRFWIPEELAYKGAPGRPQGMLVFDFELLEIKPTVSPDHAPKR